MLLTGEISPVSVIKAFEDERKLKSSNNYFGLLHFLAYRSRRLQQSGERANIKFVRSTITADEFDNSSF